MLSNRKQIHASGGSGRRAGFTLAEVLAALLFMAIVIPVAMQALRIAARAGEVADRKSVAVRLADSQLNEWIVTGQWRAGAQNGTFGDQWPGYRWTLKNETWNQDPNLNNMHLLTIDVTYPSQNPNGRVRLSTLVQDTQ
jgi:type II secretory pathway pseudopilin PulG